jgi:hypothetical protein
MPTLHKLSILEWSISIASVLVGMVVFGTYIFCRVFGVTPEDELTLAAGVPGDVTITGVSGGYGAKSPCLHFTVAGYRMIYCSGEPNYEEIQSAVESCVPVRAWVSTKQETVFSRQDWVPLYKLSTRRKTCLTYTETVDQKSYKSTAGLLCGGIAFAIGVWGIFHLLRLRWFKSIKCYAASSAGLQDLDERHQIARAWSTVTFISILACCIFLGANLDPRVRARQVQTFGDDPLGLPVTLVVMVVQALLFLPAPWVFRHCMEIAYQAHQDGELRGWIPKSIGLMVYGLTVGSVHPHLRRSQRICFCGIVYFVVVFGVVWGLMTRM